MLMLIVYVFSLILILEQIICRRLDIIYLLLNMGKKLKCPFPLAHFTAYFYMFYTTCYWASPFFGSKVYYYYNKFFKIFINFSICIKNFTYYTMNIQHRIVRRDLLLIHTDQQTRFLPIQTDLSKAFNGLITTPVQKA